MGLWRGGAWALGCPPEGGRGALGPWAPGALAWLGHLRPGAGQGQGGGRAALGGGHSGSAAHSAALCAGPGSQHTLMRAESRPPGAEGPGPSGGLRGPSGA